MRTSRFTEEQILDANDVRARLSDNDSRDPELSTKENLP
jgi:hypothetical protein